MTRNEFKSLCSSFPVVLDGATGTEMIKRGMPRGVCPELWALENFTAIADIHNQYISAGSNIVYAPTFGANEVKLAEYGLQERAQELNRELVKKAKANANGRAFVFGDISPTGMIFAPAGPLQLETAINIFKKQITALAEGGADGIVIETMIDFAEARAALIAAREAAPELPVMLTMTFEPGGTTLSGNPPESCLITAQALGADAFGCNCSCGPEAMLPIIQRLKKIATVPIIAKPNAGMPKLEKGATVFTMTPEDFGKEAVKLTAAGVNIIGGCCGTSPAHIASAATQVKTKNVIPPLRKSISAVASARGWHIWEKNSPVTIIGERINPTGKKALQAELRDGSMELVRRFAREQTAAGAAILDVNMGLSGIDEKQMMLNAIDAVSAVTPLPLCIDSGSAAVMESALRHYPGRALVNSVTAEPGRLQGTLQAAAKYGALIIILPVSETGIPATLQERTECIKKIFAEAEKAGLTKDDVIIDALTMTVSADPMAAVNTLATVDWAANEFGCHVLLGLSNVSFGMPERETLNAAMLTMAVAKGLDTAILNPSIESMRKSWMTANALTGRDKNFKSYLAATASATADSRSTAAAAGTSASKNNKSILYDAVLDGSAEDAEKTIRIMLADGCEPGDILNNILIPAIQEVGSRFGAGKIFLPQLIMSADAMAAGADILTEILAQNPGNTTDKPKFVIATVKDDIHDIGKNIAALLFRNYGFEVIDLGKDVAAETIVNTLKSSGASLLGLSALMTTTMPRMQETVEAVRNAGLEVDIIVGGAAVDEHFANTIGATYAADAMEAVNWAQKIISRKQD